MTRRYEPTPQEWAAARAETAAAAQAAIAARNVMGICCYEPRCEHGCPLCGGYGHPRCVSAPGALACVTPGCGNPHHRRTTKEDA